MCGCVSVCVYVCVCLAYAPYINMCTGVMQRESIRGSISFKALLRVIGVGGDVVGFLNRFVVTA